MKMFRGKTTTPKPKVTIGREPSRGPASYDTRPRAPAPRPDARVPSDTGTQNSVQPNTLVVAVDFGTFAFRVFPICFLRHRLLTDRTGTTFTGSSLYSFG